MSHTCEASRKVPLVSVQQLAKFDSSQVFTKIPCFKRQKTRGKILLGPLCPCVWYLFIFIAGIARQLSFLSLYANLPSDTVVIVCNNNLLLMSVLGIHTKPFAVAVAVAVALSSIFLSGRTPGIYKSAS